MISCCPACFESVTYEQFCDDFKCQNCGVVLTACHECCYEADPEPDSWCEDWLEVVTT